MNIIVIGSVRTKSAALTQYLHKKYPECTNWGEPLYDVTIQCSNPLIKNKQKFIDKKLKEFIDAISMTENNLFKVLGSNLFGLHSFVHNFDFTKFSEIHLIEREDFFDQVCSITVAQQEKLYHKTKDNISSYNMLEKKQFQITKTIVLQTAFDVLHYILIKEYLIKNNFSFTQHTYDNLRDIDNLFVLPNNLSYSNLITNHYLKQTVTDIFLNNFSYQNMYANLENFTKDLDTVLF